MKYLITKSSETQLPGSFKVAVVGKFDGDVIITLSSGAQKLIPGVIGTDSLNNKFVVEEARDGYVLVYDQPSAAMKNL